MLRKKIPFLFTKITFQGESGVGKEHGVGGGEIKKVRPAFYRNHLNIYIKLMQLSSENLREQLPFTLVYFRLTPEDSEEIIPGNSFAPG